MRLLGLDPGLRRTGWGVIAVEGSRLSHIGNGVIATDEDEPIARRLAVLHDALAAVIDEFRPDEAAVEATFVNKNAASTLKLGMARGAVMLAPARLGLPVAEYAPNLVKKSIVGTGHAEKAQVERMVRVLLPGCAVAGPDAADALAIAICHAHHRESRMRAALQAALLEGRA